jgi:hypothetical protein
MLRTQLQAIPESDLPQALTELRHALVDCGLRPAAIDETIHMIERGDADLARSTATGELVLVLATGAAFHIDRDGIRRVLPET